MHNEKDKRVYKTKRQTFIFSDVCRILIQHFAVKPFGSNYSFESPGVRLDLSSLFTSSWLILSSSDKLAGDVCELPSRGFSTDSLQD